MSVFLAPTLVARIVRRTAAAVKEKDRMEEHEKVERKRRVRTARWQSKGYKEARWDYFDDWMDGVAG